MATSQTSAYVQATVAGYTVKTTPTSSALSGATDTLVSTSIASNTDTIENKKIVAGMDVKVAFSDVAATLVLQVSHNGTDWADAVTITSDTTPNVTGVKTFLVDLTNIYAPYFRIHFNPTGLSVGTSGTAQFFYAFT
tara:strand:+ start:1764 stop:2174 length:411 start_codon:yes stop_codon:yes gene_type:complete